MIKRGDGILKVMLIFFSFFLLGNIIEYLFVNKESLKKITARVSDIKFEIYECATVRFRKSTCERTIIWLENVKGAFSISDRINRGAYIDGITKGDLVTIYIRKWYQYILTFGGGRTIYGLKKDGFYYYDIGRWKASNISWMIVFGILTLFFGGLYILQRVATNKLLSSITEHTSVRRNRR